MDHGSFVIEKLFKHYNVHVEQQGNNPQRKTVLMVNGALDEYTPAAEAKVFKQYVARSSFAVAEQTGHLLDLESSEAAVAVHRELLDFLMGKGATDGA